jgi:hypothetical protein
MLWMILYMCGEIVSGLSTANESILRVLLLVSGLSRSEL